MWNSRKNVVVVHTDVLSEHAEETDRKRCIPQPMLYIFTTVV